MEDTDTYFVPDQDTGVSIEDFMRAINLVTSLTRLQAMQAAEAADLVQQLNEAFSEGSTQAFETIVDDLRARSVQMSAIAPGSQLLDLIQYFVSDGQAVTMRSFQTLASIFDSKQIKEVVAELKRNPLNAAIVNPRKFSYSYNLNDEEKMLLFSDIKTLNPTYLPPYQSQTIKVPFTLDDGQVRDVTFGPIPVIQLGGADSVLPTFHPSITRAHTNVLLYNMLAVLGAGDSKAVALRNALAVAHNQTFKTTGTPAGQVGRYKAVLAVHNRVLQTINKRTPKQYRAMAEAAFKFETTAADVEEFQNGLTTDIVQFAHSGNLKVLTVNPLARSGPMYGPGVKKNDSYGFDLNFATLLLRDCGQLLAKDKSAFWQKWKPILFYYMSPKMEVYQREQLTSKTRNIFVGAQAPNILAGIILRYATSTLRNWRDGCLLNFVMAHGGFDEIYGAWLKLEQPTAYTFSDNIYVVVPGHGMWSVDGAKMEASTSLSGVAGLMSHFMLAFWGPIKKANPDVFNLFFNFAVHVYPRVVAKGIALLFNQQLPIPGQPSGTQATAVNNQMMAHTAAMAIQTHLRTATYGKGPKKGKPYPLDQRIKDVFGNDLRTPGPVMQRITSEVGVVLTIERHQKLVLTPGVPLEIDFLGMGAQALTFEAVTCVVPVLERARLINSLNYSSTNPKELEGPDVLNSLGLKVRLTGMREVLIEYVRISTLIMIGGWAYDDMSPLRQVAVELWHRVMQATPDPVTLQVHFDEMTELMGEGFRSIVGGSPKDVVSISGPPSLFSVFKLFASQEQIAQVTQRVEERARDGTLTDDDYRTYPWSMLSKFDGTERMAHLAGEQTLDSVYEVLYKTSRPTGPFPFDDQAPPSVLITEAPSDPEQTKREKGPVLNPARPLHKAGTDPGRWVVAEPDHAATELLSKLYDASPILFQFQSPTNDRGKPVPLKNQSNWLRGQFAAFIQSYLNSKGGKHDFNRIRRSIENFYQFDPIHDDATKQVRLLTSTARVPGAMLISRTEGGTGNFTGDLLSRIEQGSAAREPTRKPKQPLLYRVGK